MSHLIKCKQSNQFALVVDKMLASVVLISALLYNCCRYAAAVEYVVPFHYQEHETIIAQSYATQLFRFYSPPRDSLLVTGTECTTTSSPSPDYCPLIYFLQDVRDRLREVITPAPQQHQNTETNGARVRCDGRNHFTGLHLGMTLDDYVEQLGRCPGQLILVDPNFDYAHSFETYYESIHNAYDVVYYTGSDDTKENQGAHALALTMLNTAGFMHYLAESERWTKAMADCKNGIIPATLVREELLSEWLRRVDNPAIPARLTSSYYAMKELAECAWNGNELLVRLSIPVRESDWRLVTLSPIPFRHVYQGSVYMCMVEQEELSVYYDRITGDYVSAENCNPTDVMCIGPRGRRVKRKSCVHSVLTRGSDVHITCPLACKPREEYLDDVVSVFERTVYVAGERDDHVVRCPDVNTTIHPPEEGNARIQLPCECLVETGIGKKYRVSSCEQSMLDVMNIEPLHFSARDEAADVNFGK